MIYKKPWRNLQNAKHIDTIIHCLGEHSKLGNRVRNHQDVVPAWSAIIHGPKREIVTEVLNTLNAFPVRISGVARCAIVALVEHDDCAHMLYSDPNELEILAMLGDSRAILILDCCKLFNELSISVKV